jgi:hypothetical protein
MPSPFTMETNLLDTPTTCAKSVSMGSSPNYFRYPWACGLAMCVELKSRLLSNALATIVAFVCQF